MEHIRLEIRHNSVEIIVSLDTAAQYFNYLSNLPDNDYIGGNETEMESFIYNNLGHPNNLILESYVGSKEVIVKTRMFNSKGEAWTREKLMTIYNTFGKSFMLDIDEWLDLIKEFGS